MAERMKEKKDMRYQTTLQTQILCAGYVRIPSGRTARGHPLGYIASDILQPLQRLKGFNVLHPMGFDSFGLPAEQYALKPASTRRNHP